MLLKYILFFIIADTIPLKSYKLFDICVDNFKKIVAPYSI